MIFRSSALVLHIDSCFYLWCAVIKFRSSLLRSIIESVWDIISRIVCIKGHGHASSSDVRLSKIRFYNDNLQDPKTVDHKGEG